MSEQIDKPSAEELASLSKIILRDGVIGSIDTFSNFDPTRIRYYEKYDDHIVLYMSEIDRLDAIQQYKSTLEAFKYEVDRGVREEAQAFKHFEYDDDFTKLTFYVNRTLFSQDISAMMIERSIVDDILKYQLYYRKPIQVHVRYIDMDTKQLIEQRFYPSNATVV